ncbi:MAG TPA: alpha-hydroxy-acid oxidizing protein [Lacunisphaera sp.]|nr:alpha-hydroxy-acid oxidizing protein [Lacunisphaera sp.]
MNLRLLTRRQALGATGALLAGCCAAQGRAAIDGRDSGGLPSLPCPAPVDELVLVREFEDGARRVLPDAVFAMIASGDREAFERITLRPRMMIPTANIDLGVELFGRKLLAPIVVGPVAEQRRFHPDAELATARGAAAANVPLIVSSRSSVPLEQLAAETKNPLWFQAEAGPAGKAPIQRAVSAGCEVVCLTLGAEGSPPDWHAIAELRRSIDAPVLVKGVMTPSEAEAALQHGGQGIVVSNHGRSSTGATIMALPSIVDTVAGKAPVLVDGGFELGADIFRALAFGAQGVLVARPAMWGLAAYGADGVRAVLQILQCDLARTMAMCGNATVTSLDRSRLKTNVRRSS